jgi:hypothetical protein
VKNVSLTPWEKVLLHYATIVTTTYIQSAKIAATKYGVMNHTEMTAHCAVAATVIERRRMKPTMTLARGENTGRVATSEAIAGPIRAAAWAR